ncbi:iron chaperone [Actinosynnema sp. CS-041913]|uniref:iron chaperone n=1 Tax=Actinosynnema sp. CS-041913 TaxID=3239917 RepID=UPI003D8A7EBC
MARSDAATVEEYLAELPADRRAVVAAVRDVILANLPPGYDEGMAWGMITYSVPLSRSGKTYNGQPLAYVSLASQKNHLSLYLMGVYGEHEQEFRAAFEATGRKLDMGKSCVRFKRLDDLPLDVIGREVARRPVDEFVAKASAART